MKRFACLCIAVVFLAGCTSVKVTKDPKPHDKGFRYYRPKPYLMITPGVVEAPAPDPAFTSTTVTTQDSPVKVATPATPKGAAVVGDPNVRLAQYESDRPEVLAFGPTPTPTATIPPVPAVNAGVLNTGGSSSGAPPSAPGANQPAAAAPAADKIKATISLMYMPDFAEEYSVRLCPGLGIGELSIELENGWNLTSVGMKTDQQTAEIITSAANLIGSVGKAAGIGGTDATPIANVLATNIPFGMYEAVIAQDPSGRKQLYGWRYVGFMPFQSCPVTACGMQSVSCHDPNAIYGLVMDNTGTMRFERIGEIPFMKQKVDEIQFKPQPPAR